MIWRQDIHKVVLGQPDSWSNWNLEVLFFENRVKPEFPEKNLSEQGREPTTISTHTWRQHRNFEPGSHCCEVSTLSTVLSLLPNDMESENVD